MIAPVPRSAQPLDGLGDLLGDAPASSPPPNTRKTRRLPERASAGAQLGREHHQQAITPYWNTKPSR